MVLLTIGRIRCLGLTAGMGCILVGLIVTFFPPAGLREEHLATFASFLMLPIIGFTVIFFTHIRDVALIAEAASYGGYTPSEDEKRRVEERLREMGKLYLLVPILYTIIWMMSVYFLDEPLGLSAESKVAGIYAGLTWVVPMLLIIFILIPEIPYRKRRDTRVLLVKAVEGAIARRRMRELGETSPDDLRILRQEEPSGSETKREGEPKKSESERR